MAENGSSGPSGATIALVGLVATPIVLFLVFWLVGGSSTPEAPVNLPNVQGKGLAWAKNEVDKSGFNSLQTYDSLGRDRRWRDDKDWMVCFESPAPGARAKDVDVKLGVVKIEERCPAADQGVYTPATGEMPDLTNRTAFMASKILGPDASVRFLDREDGDEVTNNLGDWRICSQSPAAGDRFDGLPVTTLVVKYEEKC
jgi:hypothetical protein